MTQGLAEARSFRKLVALPLIIVVVGIAVSGCPGPPKREYVLGAAAASNNTSSAVQTALPVVQIERVVLPDYLDSRDILTRSGGQIVASETGRWAERLSVGVSRALAAFLSMRLTHVVVTSGQPIEPPFLRVLVDVLAFEATPSQQVVLTARWTITQGIGGKSLAVEQSTFKEPVVPAAGDSAIVAAMSLALENLADRMAGSILEVKAGIKGLQAEQDGSARERHRHRVLDIPHF